MMYEQVMPFVVTRSNGGVYEDTAFIAGWLCGELAARMPTIAATRATFRLFAPPPVVRQLDLIAMQYRYTASTVAFHSESMCDEVLIKPQ